ncbi:chloride channel protein [Actinomycetospora atypica]|uniref:Chloride channel protein n=1 Tax=Actinomycetospora atypica TaxID=1290095 RepID=A0ABV9YLL4_9PSEU
MSLPGAPSARDLVGLAGLGAVVGVPAALLAAVFIALVHQCEVWLWTDLPRALGHDGPPWYLVVVLPVVGAAIVGAARLLLPGDGGHEPLDGIVVAPTPWQHAPGIALAALGTLAFGGILGPEAPLIALGSVVGVVLTRIVRTGPRATGVMATAGSFSAISALFGSPLVAGMLLLEASVLGGGAAGVALLAALLPGLVAAAVGYVLFTGLGEWAGLDRPGLAVGDLPPYVGTHVADLALAVVVGVGAALLVAAVRRLAVRTARRGPPGRRAPVLGLLLAGGAAVGLLAQGSSLLTGSAEAVLFSGQAAIPQLVAQESVLLLLVVVATKALGYAVCLSCGFRGGPVFPAIFLGIGIATVAVIVFGASPTWAVAVGVAAGTAASTGLVFGSLIFAAILVGGNGLDALPAAVLATAAAWITRAALERRTAATSATASTPSVPDDEGPHDRRRTGGGTSTHQEPRAVPGTDQP